MSFLKRHMGRILCASIVWAAIIGICSAQNAAKPPVLTVTADTTLVCAGGQVKLTATVEGDKADNVQWSLSSESAGKLSSTTGKEVTFTAAGTQSDTVALAGDVTITATLDGQTKQIVITLAGPCQPRFGGEMTRVVVGFEQIGASGTPSDQKFFFDFFIGRPVPFGGHSHSAKDNKTGKLYPVKVDWWGPRLRWWGDVRIGSYPQQVNSSVANFAQQFSTNVGNLKVNQLAQSIEFMTGPELRLAASRVPRASYTDNSSRQRFALTAFAGAGATGPNNPTGSVTVFQVPSDKTSPQYTALTSQFGPITSAYVAFVPQSRDRFLHQWTAGFRLYTFYTKNTAQGEPITGVPATVEISLGQNELVTNGHLSGIVGHAAAAYPLALGDRTKSDTLVVYLFGEATTAFKKAQYRNSLILAPATDNSGNPIPITDPQVTILTVQANRRDTYRIGVALDLLSVWKKLTASSQQGSPGGK
jgi:hypothetical protein